MAPVDVHEQLKALIELQAVDKQLYDLTRQRQAKPAQIERLKAEHQHETQRVKECEAQLKALQLRRSSMEGDLAAKEGQVKKLQMQLYQVKTNKEPSLAFSRRNLETRQKSRTARTLTTVGRCPPLQGSSPLVLLTDPGAIEQIAALPLPWPSPRGGRETSSL